MGTSSSSDANDETNDEGHVKDMNTFMAHIGVCYLFNDKSLELSLILNFSIFLKVPFLMIPPPKSQELKSPTMSPTTRRRMLRPLIISSMPNIF